MLLLPGALLAELAHHFLAKPCRFSEHIVQPIKHLFQGFSADRAPVRHSFRKDYVIRGLTVKHNYSTHDSACTAIHVLGASTCAHRHRSADRPTYPAFYLLPTAARHLPAAP